jgi:hypothetical protein
MLAAVSAQVAAEARARARQLRLGLSCSAPGMDCSGGWAFVYCGLLSPAESEPDFRPVTARDAPLASADWLLSARSRGFLQVPIPPIGGHLHRRAQRGAHAALAAETETGTDLRVEAPPVQCSRGGGEAKACARMTLEAEAVGLRKPS